MRKYFTFEREQPIAFCDTEVKDAHAKKRKKNFLGFYIYIYVSIISFSPLSLFLSIFISISFSPFQSRSYSLVSKYWFIATTLKTSSISHNTVLLHAKPLFGHSTVMEDKGIQDQSMPNGFWNLEIYCYWMFKNSMIFNFFFAYLFLQLISANNLKNKI